MKKPSWDEESILEAIRRWVKEVGEVPAAGDWEDRERHPCHPHWLRHRGEFPTRPTVTRLCGSWAEAVEAAGFQPRNVRTAGTRRMGRERANLEARRDQLKEELAKVEEELEALE